MTSKSQIASTAQEMLVGARLVASLRPYLRRPVTLTEARAGLARRLEQRESTFLGLVRHGVYSNAASPYRRLLGIAGCEYGDVERLVWQDGVEGAMRALYRSGVYLTADEFKGRQPAIRGSAVVDVHPSLLRNPRATIHVPAQTGGTSGAATLLGFDLRFLRETGSNHLLGLQARGGIDWAHAVWTVPGGNALSILGPFLLAGTQFARWFSLIDPTAAGLHVRYQWSGRALRWGCLLGGVQLPRPSYAPIEQPLPAAAWMASVLRSGRTPHLYTSTSAAVRLCQAAVASGVDLQGAEFTVGGEPVTADRLAEIERAGAHAVPRYTATDFGTLGYGCGAPQAPDEIHVPLDRVAIIQPGPDAAVSGLPAQDLMITSISAWSGVILLNVSLGDQGELGERACGCPLAELGWATHLHTVRSYEKLTAGGMTFLDTQVIRVLEHVLPERFGGTATHYQLLDDNGTDGQPRLWLLVHPDLGPLNADAVAEAFLEGIAQGSDTSRMMSQVWRESGFLQVVREPPRASEAGKILHLHSTPR
jgi:hypothetical protein